MRENAREKIQFEFQRRRKLRSGYSMRRFAKDAGLSPAFLSQVLSGKRRISLESYLETARRLGILDAERREEAAPPSAPASPKKPATGMFDSPEFVRYSATIASEGEGEIAWLDLAIVELTQIAGFRSDVLWIARQLGVPAGAVSASIEKMKELGILSLSPAGEIVKTKAKIHFGTKKSHAWVREYHREAMRKGIAELENADEERFRQRLITGITLSVGSASIAGAQKKIQRFMDELCDDTSRGKLDRVYQFNVQFFPVD